MRGRILVIRGGAIGDFILTLPVLSALRGTFPETQIEVLGYPKIASLALEAGTVDAVRPIEAQALAGFFAKGGTLAGPLQEYFASFNIILSYLYDPDGIFQENVLRCTSAQFHQGPHRPNEEESVHATDVFLKPLERLAIFEANSTPRLSLTEAAMSNCLALHPGSGSEAKNWPESSWVALLQRIAQESSLNLLLVGGEAEGSRLERLYSLLPPPRRELAKDLPLPTLAKKLSTCSLFVGHDSGITHLAAAVGLRGVALWGPSNPEIWRPRSNRFDLLHEPQGLAALQPDSVFQAIRQRLT